MFYKPYSYLAKSECFSIVVVNSLLFDYCFIMNENAELLPVAININVNYVFEKTLTTNCFLNSHCICNLFQILPLIFYYVILLHAYREGTVLVAKYDVADCHKNKMYSYSWPTAIYFSRINHSSSSY